MYPRRAHPHESTDTETMLIHVTRYALWLNARIHRAAMRRDKGAWDRLRRIRDLAWARHARILARVDSSVIGKV